ncbi:acyltransferase family protein [Zwartia sp.]|uniref:acyltransferase family protein n=1 Tax=Zwartia sp. TaxID=2978004 RepID=UPI003BAEED49
MPTFVSNKSKNNANSLSNNAYRPDIDGLRAIAVLLVIGFHASPNWIKGGFIGVDIFFVISGYLITKNIVGDLSKDKFEFIDFYSRRARRIFPALILVLLFSGLIGWLYLLGPEFKQLGKHIAGGTIFIENILYFNEVGYFDADAYTKPLLNLWSLGIEEQFYIFWPLFLWICWRKNTNIYICILIITIISFGLNIYEKTNQHEGLYYLPQTRFWELGAGALLACFQNKEWFVDKNYKKIKFLNSLSFESIKINNKIINNNIISLIGAALIAFGLLMINTKVIFPGWWALAPVMGTVLIIQSGKNTLLNEYVLSNKVLVYIGLISFPLYLWHWVLLSFGKIIYVEGFTFATRLILVGISFLFAWLTYQYIEKPIRYAHKVKIRIEIIYTILALVFIFGITIYLNNGFPNRKFAKNYSLLVSAFNDWNWKEGMLEKSLSNGNTYNVTNNEEVKIAFIGDSHVQQFGPRIVKLFKEGGFKNSAFYTIPGCPPIPNVYDDKHPQCRSFISNINLFLNENPQVQKIVIGACWNCYFETEASEVTNYNNFNYYYEENNIRYYFRDISKEGVKQSKLELEKYISELSKKYKVYLLLDNPMNDLFDPRKIIGNRLNLIDLE